MAARGSSATCGSRRRRRARAARRGRAPRTPRATPRRSRGSVRASCARQCILSRHARRGDERLVARPARASRSGGRYGPRGEGRLLVIAGAHNIPPKVQEVTAAIPLGKGMAGLAWQHDKPIQTCNLKEDNSGAVKPGAKAVDARRRSRCRSTIRRGRSARSSASRGCTTTSCRRTRSPRSARTPRRCPRARASDEHAPSAPVSVDVDTGLTHVVPLHWIPGAGRRGLDAGRAADTTCRASRSCRSRRPRRSTAPSSRCRPTRRCCTGTTARRSRPGRTCRRRRRDRASRTNKRRSPVVPPPLPRATPLPPPVSPPVPLHGAERRRRRDLGDGDGEVIAPAGARAC